MATIKPISKDKKLGDLYLNEIVQVYGVVPCKTKTPFNAKDAQEVLQKHLEAKKSIKAKFIATATGFDMKKKGAFGKKPKVTSARYSDVKSFYQFSDSPSCLVVGISGKGVPGQYLVLGMPKVENAILLYKILQNGQWAPKNNLSNKIPAIETNVAPPPAAANTNTTSSSSSSSSSSRSQSLSPERPRSQVSKHDRTMSVGSVTASNRVPSVQPAVQRSPSLSSTSSATSSTSGSSSSAANSGHASRHTISRYTPTRASNSSSSPAMSRTPSIHTPCRPPSQTQVATPVTLIVKQSTPRQTPLVRTSISMSVADNKEPVEYPKVSTPRTPSRQNSKDRVTNKNRLIQALSDSDDEFYRVKPLTKKSPRNTMGTVFLITNKKTRRLTKQALPVVLQEQPKSSKICYFRPESDSSDSDSTSDDEFEVRKISTNAAPGPRGRASSISSQSSSSSSSSSSSNSSSSDDGRNGRGYPFIYRIPIKK